jgi:putative MATE family efflux protein
MFEGPVLGPLSRLALPVFGGMLFQLLYGIVDTIWISRIDLSDPSYVGGVGLIIPLFFLAVSLSSGMLIGVGSLVARTIGERNETLLHKVPESGLLIGGAIALLLVGCGYVFDERIVELLGARGDYYVHALDYLRFILPAGGLLVVGNVFLGLLHGEGLMDKLMKAMIITTVINVVLDPVFIFWLGLGVRGAGMATVISQVLTGFYLVWVFLAGKSSIRIQWRWRNIDTGTMGKIAAVGFPQTAGLITMALSFLFFNRLVIRIDRYALTAFALCLRFDQLMIMPLLAIGSAIITMIGQNYGRGNLLRVRKIWTAGTLLGMGTSGFLAAVLFLFAPAVFGFFSEVDQVVRYAVLQVRIVEFSFIGAAVVIIGRSAFQAMARPLPGLIITALRLAVIALPLAYLLVYTLDLNMYGVWLSLVSGNIVAAAVGYVWLRSLFEKTVRKLAASRDNAADS